MLGVGLTCREISFRVSGQGRKLGSLSIGGNSQQSQGLSNFLRLNCRVGMCRVSDNTLAVANVKKQAVANVKKQGGTRSPGLQRGWQPQYSPGQSSAYSACPLFIRRGRQRRSQIFLSRRLVYQDEWARHRKVFQELVARWESPDVGLFAARSNAKVARFCSVVGEDRP